MATAKKKPEKSTADAVVSKMGKAPVKGLYKAAPSAPPKKAGKKAKC